MVRAGRPLVLRSTHVRGNRYFRQQMNDIIETSSTLSHPNLFLTMTCNLAGPEISREMLQNLKVEDCPDLCVHVFHMKIQQEMRFIMIKVIFGNFIACVRVIEFLERG